MKLKKIKVFTLLIAIVMLVTALPSTQVEAGAIKHTIDSSTWGNDADWNNFKGDVVAGDGKLVFPKESTEKTSYISKSVIRKDDYFSTLATVECSLKLTQLPAGKSFILAFGLAGIEAGAGESGNVEVTFTNNGGIKVGVVAYEKNDKAVVVCEPKSVGMSLNKSTNVKAEVATNGTISVYVSGQKVCSGTLPVDGEGRVGFIQTGGCGAEVSSFVLTYNSYNRPENSNIEEDFEEGSLNISVLGGKTLVGNKTFSFAQHDGSTVLMFQDVEQTYVGTQYQYANFEMTFDVPHLMLTTSEDEAGNVLAKTGSIGISIGAEKLAQSKGGYTNALDMVVFHKDGIYSLKNKDKYSVENPYWQQDKDFSVKVAVVDCVVTVGAKWTGDTAYKTLLSYNLGNIDTTGYLHFWVMDQSNMAIDNLVIKNMDNNPTLIETEFKSGLIVKPEDAVYEPFERVYAVEAEEETNGFSWYLLIPITIAASAVALAVTAYLGRGKGKKKEETANEK